ncbi:hypothetical protein PFISCL1PPCAC_15515, partial [Pristionchus fissidentatus]
LAFLSAMKLWLILWLVPCLVFASLRPVGNVAIVARSTSLLHTPSTPAYILGSYLSCGAEKLGETVSIVGGQFTKEGTTRTPFDAKVIGNRAVLEIGKAPLRSAGRYQCEVMTSNDELVTGNLVVYLSPVLELDHEVDQEITSQPHTVLLKHRNIKIGSDLTLDCSSFGYPEPFVRWEKDGKTLSGDVEYDGHSILIKKVNSSHSGMYSCHAENSFPLFVGGPSMPHQTTLRVPIVVQ